MVPGVGGRGPGGADGSGGSPGGSDGGRGVGPANDGGYYLLGVRSMQPILFERIHWSTAVVAQQTRARAAEAGLQMADLPPWHDLDTVSALQALIAPGAPRTRAFVAALNQRN